MKINLAKISLLTLLAAAVVALPVTLRAQDANTKAPDQAAPAKAKKGSATFHGAVTAVDTKAMTFTVGDKTYNVTSETKITKNGQPATLSDVTTGETVGGTFKKGADGKLNAATLHVGVKEGKGEGKKKKDTGN